MQNVLIINSSISGEASQSKALTAFAKQIFEEKGGVKIVERDLASETLDHLSMAEMATWRAEENSLNETQKELRGISDQLIAELDASDTLIIGVPMYNFGIPSNLKAYIDRICRAGVTFKYSENGPVGLLSAKKIIIVATRGGMYQGTPKDTQTTYIKDVFAFIGQTDVEFVYAEGLAMSTPNDAIESAKQTIKSLLK